MHIYWQNKMDKGVRTSYEHLYGYNLRTPYMERTIFFNKINSLQYLVSKIRKWIILTVSEKVNN